MKQIFAPALLVVGLMAGVAAGAQTVPADPRSGAPVVTPAPQASTISPNGPVVPILPGSLSGSPAHSAQPSPAAEAPARPPQGGPSATPQASPTSANHFHLHRPGTDVDGDLLTGNALSDVYIFHGNVILRSDPKIDRAFAATESDEAITVTADEIDVDRFGTAYVAKGHVHFVQGNRSGGADTAMLNEQTNTLDLLGNADVLDGEQRARAAKMHYNLVDRRFHGSGDVRIYEPAPTPGPSASSTPAPKRRRRLPI